MLVKQVEEEEANVERACSLALLALQYLLYCSASKAVKQSSLQLFRTLHAARCRY